MQAPGLFDINDPQGKYGLVHNIGIGGAVVCSLLRRPEFYRPDEHDGRSRYVACVFWQSMQIVIEEPRQVRL